MRYSRENIDSFFVRKYESLKNRGWDNKNTFNNLRYELNERIGSCHYLNEKSKSDKYDSSIAMIKELIILSHIFEEVFEI